MSTVIRFPAGGELWLDETALPTLRRAPYTFDVCVCGASRECHELHHAHGNCTGFRGPCRAFTREAGVGCALGEGHVGAHVTYDGRDRWEEPPQ